MHLGRLTNMGMQIHTWICRSTHGYADPHMGISPGTHVCELQHLRKYRQQVTGYRLHITHCTSSSGLPPHGPVVEDVITADPFLGRSRVRFRVPPWVSNTIARDHLA